MPGSIVEAYLGTLAVCFTGKALQKFAEVRQQRVITQQQQGEIEQHRGE